MQIGLSWAEGGTDEADVPGDGRGRVGRRGLFERGTMMAGIDSAAMRIWRSRWTRRIGSALLFFWFAYWTWQVIGDTFSAWPYHLDVIGVDGRLYYRAAGMWVSGGDPWTAYTATNTWPPGPQWIHFLFTGPPPTVLAFVPFVWIPESIFVIAWLGLTAAAAVYALRRLHLPVWWILFPPLAQGILVGNPHVVCLALLLSGSRWLQALAAPMKAYAVVPMIGERQWRALGLLIVGLAISLVIFWPLWAQYFKEYSTVQDWLIGATHWNPDRTLYVAAAVALGALALIDRRAASWLAVAALWPGGQFFYLSFILPAAPVLAPLLTFNGWRPVPIVPSAIADHALGMNNLFQIIVAYALARLVLRILGYAHRRQVLGRACRALRTRSVLQAPRLPPRD
jgi:hypothetical protein